MPKIGDVRSSSSVSDLASVDLLIECYPEDFEVKKSLFSNLHKEINEKAIFASNTSSISIEKLAAVSGRPDKFVGMHFMNPATIIPLVELIEPQTVSAHTKSVSEEFLQSLDRVIIHVKDSPGFVINRLLISMINEAAHILDEGIASVQDIDSCMKVGANHPLGPLSLADLIGLDTCLAIMETMHQDSGNEKFSPSPVLKTMCANGLLGKKTGRGFYTY